MEYRGDTEDPYVDPKSGVLRNLAEITDQTLLDDYEGEMSISRQLEFAKKPLPATFDLEHLRAIHRHLFQDVYSWAGQLRMVDIARGATRFGSHLHIEKYLSTFFSKLAKERLSWSKASPHWIGLSDLPTF